MTQLRMGRKLKKKPKDVLAKATEFFGPKGIGLKIIPQEENVLLFRNGSGFVRIAVAPTETGSEVDIQSREMSYDVKSFLRSL